MGSFQSRPKGFIRDSWLKGHLQEIVNLGQDQEFERQNLLSEPAESWHEVLRASHEQDIDALRSCTSRGRESSEIRTPTGHAALHIAAVADLIAVAQVLVNSGTDSPDVKTPLGNNALHLAAFHHANNVLDYLLDLVCGQKGDHENCLSVTNRLGFTPLHCAVIAGNFRAIELLMGCGVSRSERTNDKSDSALHLAVLCKHTDIAVYLNDDDCAVMVNKDSETALHTAVGLGDEDLVSALYTPLSLETKVKVNELRDNEGFALMHIAVKAGNLSVVEILMECLRGNPDFDLYKLLNNFGDNVLHLACYYGHENIVHYLVDHFGFGPGNYPNHFGDLPLHCVCRRADAVQLTTFLCNMEEVKINAVSSGPHQDGHTALHTACYFGHIDVVQVLISHGADPTIETIKEKTPIDMAYDQGFDSLVTALQGHLFNMANDIATTSIAWPYQGTVKNPQYMVPSSRGKLRAVIKEKVQLMNLKAILPSHFQVKFDEIIFEASIGSGSFGDVYRGTLHNERVAIKRLRTGSIRGISDVELFCREVAVMSKVSHPSIVRFCGCCLRDPRKFCLLTEFMSGGTLYNLLHIERKLLDLNAKLRIILDIAQGLAYLHGLDPKIIHRDLNSLNILLDEYGGAAISDFGESKIFTPESRNNMTKYPGNLRWMAPEVFSGTAAYTEMADVFSFGLVLWETLMSQLPFEHLKPPAAASEMAHNKKRPPIASQLPRRLQMLLKECWQHVPERRPSMSTVVKTLLKYMRTVDGNEIQAVVRGNRKSHVYLPAIGSTSSDKVGHHHHHLEPSHEEPASRSNSGDHLSNEGQGETTSIGG
eukprot:Clim_evm47s119 gene=Clim_evmTU47s119